MVPTRNLIRSHHASYSSFSDAAQFEFRQEKPPSVSPLMADDTKDTKNEEEEEEEEEEDGTSSKRGGGGDDHEGWLRLGIGTAAAASASADRNPTDIDRTHPVGPTSGSAPRRSLTELDLFSDRPSTSAVRPRMAAAGGPSSMIAPPFLPAAASGFTLGYQRNNLLAWGVHGRCMAGTSSSTRPPPPQPPESVGRVGTEMRVVSPTPRPEIGVWLDLKAAQNQEKEPLLPQIQRSYLRIKDSNMTISVLMRYLATKLGLGDESQVEITCRGQQLPPFLMLQYVRDHIWCSAEVVQLLPNSQTTDHLMTLHYSRK